MTHSIPIGKRRWLAGLTWRSFESAPNRNELKEDAKGLGASWVGVRKEEWAIQAGFCAPLEPVKSPARLYSLAAMLADSYEEPWSGMFQLKNDLWWYIAVRDGHAILPDGDVVGSEKEMIAVKERHAEYGDWNYIKGDFTHLEKLIGNAMAKPTPIKSLTDGNKVTNPGVISAIALLLAMSGGYGWHQSQLAQEQERIAVMAKLRLQNSGHQTQTAVPSPLLTTPYPNDWLSACGKSLMAQPLTRHGWLLNHLSCNTGAAIVTWTRLPGATVAMRPDGQVSPDGESIYQSIPLPVLNPADKNDAIRLNDAKLALRAWAQQASFALTIHEPVPAPVLPGAASERIPRKATELFPQVNIKLDMPVSPFGMNLSLIPGLRLTKLVAAKNGWTIEGTLYGR